MLAGVTREEFSELWWENNMSVLEIFIANGHCVNCVYRNQIEALEGLEPNAFFDLQLFKFIVYKGLKKFQVKALTILWR